MYILTLLYYKKNIKANFNPLKTLAMEIKYFLDQITSLALDIKKPCIIFLKWEIWAGKTTLSKHIINNILGKQVEVISPTYTYYNKYDDVYHFDLYRIEKYDEFFSIWWEEILDNNTWVILVEWPDIIEKYYEADIVIELKKTDITDERKIKIS